MADNQLIQHVFHVEFRINDESGIGEMTTEEAENFIQAFFDLNKAEIGWDLTEYEYEDYRVDNVIHVDFSGGKNDAS